MLGISKKTLGEAKYKALVERHCIQCAAFKGGEDSEPLTGLLDSVKAKTRRSVAAVSSVSGATAVPIRGQPPGQVGSSSKQLQLDKTVAVRQNGCSSSKQAYPNYEDSMHCMEAEEQFNQAQRTCNRMWHAMRLARQNLSELRARRFASRADLAEALHDDQGHSLQVLRGSRSAVRMRANAQAVRLLIETAS